MEAVRISRRKVAYIRKEAVSSVDVEEYQFRDRAPWILTIRMLNGDCYSMHLQSNQEARELVQRLMEES